MATTPSQLRVTELDYDQILNNLVEFMKADPTFTDYDFSGSGLRLIARVLAYVTYYNAHYLSMATNESFLDTAQLRSSVASHARMLGYEAKGARAATYLANVSVLVSNTDPTLLTLPRQTQFALQTNASVIFYNTSDATLVRDSSNTYQGTNITLIEGRPAQYRFTVDLTNPTQRFIIPNANINFDEVSVTVYDSSSSNTATVFSRASNPDLLLIDGTTPVFFVREAYNGYLELIFGNGVVGKKLEQGNVVVVDYYFTSGVAGNNIRGPFRISGGTIDGLVRGYTASPDANTVASTGGADAESIEDIRYLAPLTYQAQNRCVTTEDYKAVILDQFGAQIDAINVFGGDQGNPDDPLERPVYGKVFITVKPKTGLRFSEYTRNLIEDTVLKPHNIVGVVPEVIDPDYTYLNIGTVVSYDARLTTKSRAGIASSVTDAITTYATDNLQKFDNAFRASKLVRAIDDADPSILSSTTSIQLQKRIYPTLGENNQALLKFGTPLAKNGNTSAILLPTARFAYLDPTLPEGSNAVNGCYLRESNGLVQVVLPITSTTRTLTLALNGRGTFRSLETVYQGANLASATATGTVVKWDETTRTLSLANVVNTFRTDEIVTGVTSKAEWVVMTPSNPDLDSVRVLNPSVGTLDIATGLLRITNFIPQAIDNDLTYIGIDVIPTKNDFKTELNRMLLLNTEAIGVVVQEQSSNTTTDFFAGNVLR